MRSAPPGVFEERSFGARLFFKDGRLRPIIRVLLFLVVVILAVVAIVGIEGALHMLPPRGAAAMRAAPYLLVDNALPAAAVVGIALLMRAYIDRRSLASLGFAFQRGWLRLLCIGVLFGAGMQCIVFGIDQALGYSHIIARESAMLIARELPFLLLFLMIAALFEEMAIRGYILQNVWEEWEFVPALIVSSMLFALAHLGNPHSREQLALTVAGLLAYGAWACLSVLWTKSVWLAYGSHFAWNLFEGPVFGFPVSGAGANPHTAIVQAVSGPDWFTGGQYGPEAGVSALVALAVGLAILYVLVRTGAFGNVADTREAYARR